MERIRDVDAASVVLRLRLEQPNLPRELARKRKRRLDWAPDRLVILAADHPARRVVAAGGDPWAMADRGELLGRIAHVLAQPDVDGLLATPDIVEELLLLNHWWTAEDGPDFLNGKLLIGSMNRGGLADTVFDLDDFVTGYTADAIVENNLDGGKLLLRLDPSAHDSSKTLKYCADALNELAAFGLPSFLEPLAAPHSIDDLVRLVGVASALGSTTVGRWLKLPMVDGFERVAKATTCPILLLGGNNPGSTTELIETVERCLRAGPNVQGLMIGRGVLYPQDGTDPAEVAAQLAACVRGEAVKEVQS